MRTTLLAVFIGLFATVAVHAQQPTAMKIGKTLAESTPGVAPEISIAKGAPNVIWILIDDSGFGATSTIGGGARTPVLDKANNVYPLINWSDLSIGITEFQRKAGLLPPATTPKK